MSYRSIAKRMLTGRKERIPTRFAIRSDNVPSSSQSGSNDISSTNTLLHGGLSRDSRTTKDALLG